MDEEEIIQRLHDLTLEHGDLDDAIKLMTERPYPDQLQIKRMKTRKLRLKDDIAKLQSKLIPDIEA